MYILTALGQDTISTLKVPHKQNFEKIWQLFDNGNKKIIKESEVINIVSTINKYDTCRLTKTYYDNQSRSYVLAPEYWRWE